MNNSKIVFARWIALLALVSLTLYSCKKDGNAKEGNSQTAKTTLLTKGMWTLQKIEYQQKDGTWVNDTHAEDMDHVTLTFHTDKTVTVVDNSNSLLKQWEASTDFSQLTISGATVGASMLTINVLTQTTLQLAPLGGYSTFYIGERDTYMH